MPALTSLVLFVGQHRGPEVVDDPNLFSPDDFANYLTNSAQVSIVTSGVVSAAASGALNSVPVSTADSKGVSSGTRASVADSKSVSGSVNTSVADSKSISNSFNISIADSKATSVAAFAYVPTVGGIPGFQQSGTGTVVRTANSKMGELYSAKDFGALGDGIALDRAALVLADTAGATAGVLFPTGTYKVESNLTLSSPVTMLPGAKIKPASGVAVTINGVFDGSLTQHFDTSAGGSVVFGRGAAPIVWPQWFGCDGVNDAPAISAAVASIFATGGTIGFSGLYRTTAAIIVTCAAGETKYGLTFMNFSRQTANFVSSTPTIYAAHTGHVFDCGGAADLVFDGISIHGDTSTVPQTGWFFARNTNGSSAGRHRFVNCRSQGYFSKAVIYAYGSEENVYDNCFMINQQPNGTVMVCTAYNNLAAYGTLTSSIALSSGVISNVQHDVRGGVWGALGGGTSDVFYLDAATTFRIGTIWVCTASGSAKGRSYVTVDGTNAATDHLSVEKMYGESAAFLSDYAIRVVNGTRTHNAWRFTNSAPNLTATTGLALYGDDGQTFDNLRIDQLAGGLAAGVNIMSILYSHIRYGQQFAVHVRNLDTLNVWEGYGSLLTVDGAVTGGVRIDTQTSTLPQHSTGTAPTGGNVALVAGTVTVATTALGANQYVHLTRGVTGGTTGQLSVVRNVGVGFTINSTSGTETSTVLWTLVTLFT